MKSMKNNFIALIAGIALAAGIGVPAGAQEAPEGGYWSDFKLTSPAYGANVSRQFNLVGTLNAPCKVASYINFRDSKGNYGYLETPEASGSFNIPINMNQAVIYDYASGEEVALAPGAFLFYIYTYAPPTNPNDRYAECDGDRPHEVVLNIQDPPRPAAVKTAPPQVANRPPIIEPSPSASPSVAPVMATPEAKTEGMGLNPGIALALGALLGAALLALAEVSALEYRKKHGAHSLKK